MKHAAIMLGAVVAVTATQSAAAATETKLEMSTREKISQWTTDLLLKTTENLSVRSDQDFLSYAPNQGSQSRIETQPDNGVSASLFADLRPTKTNFMISTGIHVRTKKLQHSGALPTYGPQNQLDLTLEDTGNLKLDRSVRDAAAFAGFGVSNKSSGHAGWNYTLMAGAMVAHSENTTSLVTRETFFDQDPVLFTNLEENTARLKEDLKSFEVSPVVHAKFSFKF